MRWQADHGLGQLSRQVSIRLIFIKRQPIAADEFLIADMDQPVGVTIENPFIQNLAYLRPDRTGIRVATRLLLLPFGVPSAVATSDNLITEPPRDEIALARRLVDNDRANDRMLHAAAAHCRPAGRERVLGVP